MMHKLWHREATLYLEEYPKAPALPKAFNLFVPRSHCPHCQQPISAWQNIPLFSFLIMLGKSACCKKPIAWRYPIVELVTALVAFVVVWHFGWQWAVIPALIFSGYLLIMSFIDYDQQYLLDELTLGLLWLGILFNLFNTFTSLESAVLGAMLGYSSLWLVAKVFYLLTKREGMAYGDFKLLAAIGAWLGWESLLLVLIISSLSAIVVTVIQHCFKQRHLSHPIPFGPYLALGAWLFMLFGQQWFPMYRNLMIF